MPASAQPRLSSELARLAAACKTGGVTLRSLVPKHDARAHALVTVLFSVCFLHPIPMPGVSLVFGAIIAIAGARMAARRGLWVPERWLDRPLPAAALAVVFGAGHRVALKLEGLIKPRWEWLASHEHAVRFHGAAVAVCGLLLLIPLPPPTNFPPATAALILAVGVLERDAVVLAAGYLAFLLNLAFFGAIAVLGWHGAAALLA